MCACTCWHKLPVIMLCTDAMSICFKLGSSRSSPYGSAPDDLLLAGMPTAAQQRCRKSRKSAAASLFAHQRTKINGHWYVHNVTYLERQVAAHLKTLQEMQEEQLAAPRQEQVWAHTECLDRNIAFGSMQAGQQTRCLN